MISIRVWDGTQRLIAETEHADEAMLCVDRTWQAGDRIEICTGNPAHLCLRVDGLNRESEVYLPAGRMNWTIPAGEHRLAYRAGAFEGERHVIEVRLLSEAEIHTPRNLALNPADLRGDTDFYPHCTANVETRNESVFAARNVIDGLRLNHYHGEWPFESWGIGAREDAWCKLDFGRPVRVRKMALTLRADFPHDAYWVSGHVVTSEGEEIAFDLEKTAERQWIDLGDQEVSWLRLERMVKSDDPSAFPSLRAWEVIGVDL